MTSDATHVASGKVREIYALGDDTLALTASDRISTFDVVLPTHPGQGAGADRALGVLVRANARGRAEPPPRAPRGRAHDGLPEARDASDRVRRARVSRWIRMERLSGDWSGLRSRTAGRARRVGSPARAYLHARDEGEGGSRPEHRRGGSSGAVRRRVGTTLRSKHRSICIDSRRLMPRRAGSSWPTRSSSSGSMPGGRSCSATRRSHPTRHGSGRPTATDPEGLSRRSTSSSSAIGVSGRGGTRHRLGRSFPRTSSPGREPGTSMHSSGSPRSRSTTT